jgi:hypothetical protein
MEEAAGMLMDSFGELRRNVAKAVQQAAKMTGVEGLLDTIANVSPLKYTKSACVFGANTCALGLCTQVFRSNWLTRGWCNAPLTRTHSAETPTLWPYRFRFVTTKRISSFRLISSQRHTSNRVRP